jgi:hypothetical protein
MSELEIREHWLRMKFLGALCDLGLRKQMRYLDYEAAHLARDTDATGWEWLTAAFLAECYRHRKEAHDK